MQHNSSKENALSQDVGRGVGMTITGRANVPVTSSRHTDSDSVKAYEEGSWASLAQLVHPHIIAGFPRSPGVVRKVVESDEQT